MDNTSRVLSLIHHAWEFSTPTLLLSADVEKTFDRVSWDFLRQTDFGAHRFGAEDVQMDRFPIFHTDSCAEG